MWRRRKTDLKFAKKKYFYFFFLHILFTDLLHICNYLELSVIQLIEKLIDFSDVEIVQVYPNLAFICKLTTAQF